MSGPNNVDELITIAEAHGEPWSLLVRHGDGVLEAHHTDTYKQFADDVEDVTHELAEVLVVRHPVSCVEAVRASVELLTACPTCEPLYND